jgi:CRP/FNR family transcriptional regulator, cyclic AMP receptor protein
MVERRCAGHAEAMDRLERQSPARRLDPAPASVRPALGAPARGADPASGAGRPVSVLDADPGLAQALAPEALPAARRASAAATIWWYPGELQRVPASLSEPGALGLLVLEGCAAGSLRRDGRTRAELVGPEDLLRPWAQLDDMLGPAAEMTWDVLEPMRLAVLDRRFALATARWPEIAAGLMDHLVLRSRRLCFQMTAAGNPRGEERVHLLLWQLAERWGRVTPEGIVVPVPLTHRLLAELTGSRRPTVTSALARLRRTGLVEPLQGHRFLLRGEPPCATPEDDLGVEALTA